ncbi:MAG: hypothetical protein JXM74_01730 [Fusobacteriaceae bacterium]|nr:hypothetical protein [Fusobacteriaceae bacterium]MBN2837454.1 hypothetical protein [Fusobacteriaceae bacterium]
MDKDDIQKKIEENESGNKSAIGRFLLSSIGGVIPFVGGIIGASASAWSEKEQNEMNKIFKLWMKFQEEELEQIGVTLIEVMQKLDFQNEEINKRITSQEYMGIIKKVFRDWSASDSERKRALLRNLLANSASCNITSDDVVKIFIEWVGKYTEAHFNVISLLFNKYGITRYNMWMELYGEKVREDSPEADLFKLIIHDLSTGHVIRQCRAVDNNGNFVKQTPLKKRNASPLLKSAFDDEKPYELTNLGKQFVHYTMNEIVDKIE